MTKGAGFNRILLAVNASRHSAAAVQVVAGLAAGSQADIRVLQLWSPDETGIGWYGEVNSEKESEDLLNGAIEKLRDAGVSSTGESYPAMPDDVAEFIRSRADAFDADLIAVGNRGLSELHSFLIGSQTQRVLAHAGRPVLAVRNTKRPAGPRVRRVLLILRGGDDSARAVQACLDAARSASAEVEVVDTGSTSDWQFRAIADALAEHHIVARWRSVQSDGRIVDEIIGSVARAKADLLVIGATHARLRPLPVGDIVQRVLQSCPCPVLVAPHRDIAGTRRYADGVADAGGRRRGA